MHAREKKLTLERCSRDAATTRVVPKASASEAWGSWLLLLQVLHLQPWAPHPATRLRLVSTFCWQALLAVEAKLGTHVGFGRAALLPSFWVFRTSDVHAPTLVLPWLPSVPGFFPIVQENIIEVHICSQKNHTIN